MKAILKLHEDFIVSSLRSQTTRLKDLIRDIENRDCVEKEHLNNILKQIESNLRLLRKTIIKQ